MTSLSLSEYEEKEILVISNNGIGIDTEPEDFIENINTIKQGIISEYQMIDIHLLRDVFLYEYSRITLTTRIYIHGPIDKFVMLVKPHDQPRMSGVLKSIGYISPVINGYLNVCIENPFDRNIKISKEDAIGVLILTKFSVTY